MSDTTTTTVDSLTQEVADIKTAFDTFKQTVLEKITALEGQIQQGANLATLQASLDDLKSDITTTTVP